ncbi:hypothetical protein HPB50_003661 [Hyalomma asiaticum]|uniref:Uncharacterized protein n=1 Tax=Hyalomma asiaticum TaxID=266040 RepID=A0ACB7TEF8_HYAAI|nr:hypothetical protein HPB50_003661 [Hyalomma asiaticum]
MTPLLKPAVNGQPQNTPELRSPISLVGLRGAESTVTQNTSLAIATSEHLTIVACNLVCGFLRTSSTMRQRMRMEWPRPPPPL